MQQQALRWLTGICVVVVVVIALGWVVGNKLTDAVPRNIGRPPLDLEASNITFASASGSLIHGWLSHGTPGQGVVLLLHGLHEDRRAMLSRAEFLRHLGYSVLLIDFQAHGETRGERATLGDRESHDVSGAIAYLHHKLPGERIAVWGVSLGGAAFVLDDEHPKVAAAILDSSYPTLEAAVARWLHPMLGPVSSLIAPLVWIQIRPRLNVAENHLRPVDHVGEIGAPLLVTDCDGRLGRKQAELIFAAAREPKELWVAKQEPAADCLRSDKPAYEQHVTAFLAQYLAVPASGQ